MSLEAQLRKRLTDAMKARDSRTANVIRMVNTKIMERRTAKNFSGEIDDALVQDVIEAYRKSLVKAREQFAAAGDRGASSIEELDFEIALLGEYLPQPLSEDELRAAVKEAIAATGVSDPKQAGRLIGHVMKQHKGRAEAADIKRIAEQELGG